MAAIHKLSICGIRSFNPNEKEDVVEFYSPLTMIVGANGCGKTTIIESLKYACTGTLPPTCSNGQSFINDPTMTDATEVKANVKLRFSNKAGVPSVVVRSIQLTKRKARMEFKALDGAIRYLNPGCELHQYYHVLSHQIKSYHILLRSQTSSPHIRTKNMNNESVSTSHKCTELDKQVVSPHAYEYTT